MESIENINNIIAKLVPLLLGGDLGVGQTDKII